jgi:hypothetical protein
MTVFQYQDQGNTEAQQRLGTSFFLQQTSVGLAATGVLSGLGVTQTTTASTAVNVAAGAGNSQDTVGNGCAVMVNDTSTPLDILTGNPMGGTPRNDIVVIDSATKSIRAIIGTPNAIPTDPTVPTTAIPLARIRNLASAITIPTAQIDDLRTTIRLAGVRAPALSQQITSSVGGITGGTPVQILSGVTFVADGVAQFEVTAYALSVTGVTGDQVNLYLVDGGTALSTARVTVVASGSDSVSLTAVVTPTAGSHTFKLTAQRQSGSGSDTVVASSTAPAVIVVKQIA